MYLTSGFALAVALVLTSGSGPLAAAQPMPQAQTVQQYVQTYFVNQNEPIMVHVAECESHFTQYGADGSVYHGQINNQDIGVMQINEHYNGATAKSLGLDINTIQGNVAFAQYLYSKQGTAPWSSSQPCWGKYVNPSQPSAVAIANQ